MHLSTGILVLVFCNVVSTIFATYSAGEDFVPGRIRRVTADNYTHESRTFYRSMNGKWPWMVRLHYTQVPPHRTRNPREWRKCGGTLISKNLVLTAAHCLDGISVDKILVFVGDVHLLFIDDGEIAVAVKEIIIHYNYHKKPVSDSSSVGVNDLALLVLEDEPKISCDRIIAQPWYSTSISISSRTVPLLLQPQAMKHCFVAGYGFLAAFGPASGFLRDAKVKIMSAETCNHTCLYGGQIQLGMLCAGGRHDACQGDSGGPLMCLRHSVWHLLGVVSWGHGCGHACKPGVYADVGYYQHWILGEISRRPWLEGQFWDTILTCKSNVYRVTECSDYYGRRMLKRMGLRCPYI